MFRWRTGIGALVAAAAFATALGARVHFDTFHHLAYGRDLLRRGGFAPEDPFLFSLAGLPSGPQPSWLGSAAIYGAWRLLGDAGPGLLAALCAALLFVVLWADASSVDASWSDAARDPARPGAERSPAGLAAALLPIGLALAACRGRLVPRPEVLADLMLAATMLALRRGLASRRPAWLVGPLLVALWANLHQSVLAGLAAVGIYSAVNGAWLLLGRRGRSGLPLGGPAEVGSLRDALLPAAIALAGIAAAALTPVGLAPFRSPLAAVAGWAGGGPVPPAAQAGAAEVLRTTITELQPHLPSIGDPLDALLALGALSFLVARRRSVRELLTALLFAALAWRVQRFGAMAAVVVAPVAARNLVGGLGRLGGPALRVACWAVPAAAALALCGTAAASIWRSARETRLAALLPARAAAYLKAAGPPPRIFDTFHFGGYLEWTLDAGARVYQDARGGIPAGEEEGAIHGPARRDAFEVLDGRWRFDALVVELPSFDPDTARMLMATAPDEDWLADRRRWSLVAYDDGGLLYLRRDGALAALAARDEYRQARPAVPFGTGRPDPAGLQADLERSVREAPACARCQADLGYWLLGQGRLPDAERALGAALAGQPLTRAQARFGLFLAARRRGDLDAARAHLVEVIATAAEPAPYRRDLAVLLGQGGQAARGLAEIRKNLASAAASPVDAQIGLELARQAGDAAAEREMAARLGR